MNAMKDTLLTIMELNEELGAMLYPTLENIPCLYEVMPAYEVCEYDGEVLADDDIFFEKGDNVCFCSQDHRNRYIEDGGVI